MSNEAPMTSGSLPPDPAAHVESICRAFEASWQADGQPAIEDYLRDTPPSGRTQLLRKLLRLDLVYRGRQQAKPTLEEYRLRFPQESDLIGDVFRETPTAADLPQPVSEAGREFAADRPAVPGCEIVGRLAPGGMGVVYRARQVGLNRTVALKMIRTGAGAGPEERARFRVEAEAVASLSHPHVIPIYDCGEWDGTPYLAMEFAEGGSLAERLDGRPMPPAEAAGLVETLARAVQFVHERGLIHRDLKPANVLPTGQGVPKLADFDLANKAFLQLPGEPAGVEEWPKIVSESPPAETISVESRPVALGS